MDGQHHEQERAKGQGADIGKESLHENTYGSKLKTNQGGNYRSGDEFGRSRMGNR